ncbi:MAG: AAA family ATPase [Rikenellaceae bacterium]|nr:AAA family ATPase [Rikenellaceae bacterium]
MMSNGALFYKADLHIHSYGLGTGSFDVTDISNTPQAIVDTAIEKGLKVISITDHNQYLNSQIAVQYAKDKDILVIPGIEVSTTQGHLLLYFETIEKLQRFYIGLTFNQDNSICNQGIVECLNSAERLDGIGVLAHITLDSGFEKVINRFGPHMEQIFMCKNLLGLEITNKNEVRLYTDEDDNAEHKKLLSIWRDSLDNKLHRDLAKLMSSDSHELIKLGNNAEGNNRLTRLKMPTLTFRSFHIALMSSESRVRLEDEIPVRRPIIKHIKLEGGLLEGLDIELSPNLTCIIGSRGAGKSTLLESIREATGNKSFSKVCDSEVWPQNIILDYTDEADQTQTFQREKNANVVNRSDPNFGITAIPIESYGQGDTASTIQHSEENPQVIINFLDAFLDLDLLKTQDSEYVDLLRSNQSEMNKLRINIVSLPDAKKALENERRKLKAMEQTKAAEIIKLHNALLQERDFRKTLIQELRNLVKTYRDILGNTDLFEKVAEMSDDRIVVGKEYFSNVKSIINAFSILVSSKSKELNDALNEKIAELNTQLELWNAKESEIQGKIDDKKQELIQQGIPFDLGKINQISKDIIDYEKKVTKLQDEQKQLAELLKERQELIQNRQENKKEITRKRLAFAKKINDSLKASVDDFFVTIKYTESIYSPEFEDTLKTLMGWRTSQVMKSSVIAKNIGIYDFVSAIKKKDINVLKAIKYQGEQFLRDEEIGNIIAVLSDGFKYEDLECLTYEDYPQITVTKFVNENGARKNVTRRISQLSLGQQQSVLLSILLLSDSERPLLIDQPEDNLDSEFIFKTIVGNLRKIKERRQVIIVTHNPNIAVLGDAELIIPLKSTSARSQIISSGSIDNSDTIKLCCNILEGGDSAFKQRKNIYGF